MGRPMLSGIKELEAIEQYAEVIVAKNTNGSVFTIPMTNKDSIGKFIERGETK